jgi:hypothetical protein
MLIALLLALFFQTATPALKPGNAILKIDIMSPAQSIRVNKLPEHTVFACTVYASLDEKLGDTDEQYKPRHCWWIDPDDHMDGYGDDWSFIPVDHVYDVFVEYQVMKEPFTDPNVYDTYVSNTVRVLHMQFMPPKKSADVVQ